MNFIKNLIYKDKISKETFWAMIAKGLALLGGIFILIFVPKFAGIESYGSLMLFLAYISLVSIFFGNSINSAIKKEITERKFTEKSYNYFSQGIRIKFLIFLVSTILFYSILYLFNVPLIMENISLFLTLLFIMSFWGLIVNSFEAVHRLFYVAVMYFIEYSLKIGLILYFYTTNNLSLTTLIYSFILGYLFALIFGYILFHLKFKKFPSFSFFNLDKDMTKKILIRTFYLSLATGSLIVMAKIDTIMISFLLGIKEVGFYNIAANIAKSMTILSVPIILGVVPLFINKSRKLFQKSIKKLIIINLMIFVFFLMFSDRLILTIYGEGFESIVLIMKFLGLFPLLAVLQIFTQEILILRDTTKQIFIFGLIAVTLNIILNYYLIIHIGLVGAAISTLIAYGFWVIINIVYIAKINY